MVSSFPQIILRPSGLLLRLPCLKSRTNGFSSYSTRPFHGRSGSDELDDDYNPRERERYEDDFTNHAAEIKRRKRRAEEKRRQKGASFLDHVVISVRGGTGGSGAAAFVPMKSSSIGPPSGGNGGHGGSVYLTTSPHLTSLASVPKRVRGGAGSNGMGSYRHGKRGEDVVIAVPVGTIVKELQRESEEDRLARDDEALGLGPDELRRLRRERRFVKHPTGDISDNDYARAEFILRKEGRLGSLGDQRSSFFRSEEPIDLDIHRPAEQPILLSPGGLGGLGNPHFHDPTDPHRPPRLASRGLTPPTLTLSLELKLLADVGFVGFPNAGKSTILRALTGRRAEVADYAFTTLNPQVGVVRVMEDGSWRGGLPEGAAIEETWKERLREQQGDNYAQMSQRGTNTSTTSDSDLLEVLRFTVSDNPGLLPLASENVGLGHSFLRSIERSPVLAYVLDLTRSNPSSDLMALKKELEAYQPGLSTRCQLLIVNKADEVDEEEGQKKLNDLKSTVYNPQYQDTNPERGIRHLNSSRFNPDQVEIVPVSAKFGLGLQKVVQILGDRVKIARQLE